MRAALLLCFVLAGLAIVAGTTCPSNGVICPTQCGNTWQQCTSTTTWAPSAVPAGTVCCNGNFVYPNDPCCAGATTAAPTTKAPSTSAPSTTKASSTAAPTTKAPTTAAPTTKATTTTSGSCTLSQIFSQADFNALFPNANVAGNRGDAGQYSIFSYNAIIQAAVSYPAFGCTGTLTQRKRELAAFLGQTSQETSGWWSGQDYIWGYVYSTELCAPNSCSSYVDSSNTVYPPVGGQNYYGRGPIQVSWNYNYGAASLAITGNKNTFLNNPNLVLTDNNGVTAFKTAFWFWMTAQSPKPSCHDVMTGGFTPSAADTSAGRVAGYGLVTDIVNGGIECNTGSTPSSQSVNRVGYYSKYTNYFGVPDTTNLYCNNMQSY